MQSAPSWTEIDRSKDLRVIVHKVDTPEYTYWHAGVEIDYDRIVKAFHAPTINGDDDKRDATWEITTPYGYAELYNFKSGRNFFGSTGPAIEEIPVWHLRCQNPESLTWALDRLAGSE